MCAHGWVPWEADVEMEIYWQEIYLEVFLGSTRRRAGDGQGVAVSSGSRARQREKLDYSAINARSFGRALKLGWPFKIVLS